jgi:hypothetical protein
MHVYVRRLDTRETVHQIDASRLLGTGDYARFLRGLVAKVDSERFYVDSLGAGAEHDARLAVKER